jgi:hypothetical protein
MTNGLIKDEQCARDPDDKQGLFSPVRCNDDVWLNSAGSGHETLT